MKFAFKSVLPVLAVAALSTGALAQDMADHATVPSSAADAKPLKVGENAPNSTLRTVEGKDIELKDVLGGKPTVLIFYRGSWCPFCNKHLADLKTVQGKLTDMGFQIIAIALDKPEMLKTTMDKHELGYQLFSDSKAEALKNFGVAFRLDDATYSKYQTYGIDLDKSSGENHHILPVPSVFIIGKDGKIAYVHSNPDYKARLSGQEVVAAAKSIL